MSAVPRSQRPELPAIDGDRIVQLAEVFRLMGDGNRLRIVLACLDAPTPVGAIASSLELSPSLVSHHLRLLRAVRVLRARRQGKQVYYSVADDHIRCVIADMLEHLAEPHGQEDG